MKKLLLLLCFSLSLFSLPGDERAHAVLVTNAPYSWLVEQIAGDKLKVLTLVPSSASLHTYEPTPKQMIGVSKADIWFKLGEALETKAQSALQSYQSKMRIVDLRDGIDLICSRPETTCAHCRGGCDLHYWVDPTIMRQQAAVIQAQLARIYPEHAEEFRSNLQKVQKTLTDLDEETALILSKLKNRSFFVSHPAFAYYARRYNLSQHSIEFEGREPTPKQLERILASAKELQTKTIFTLPQFSNKGALLVADLIGAKTASVDPNSKEYLTQMRKIAAQFSAK